MHYLDSDIIEKLQYRKVKIALIGAGGNGCTMAVNLARINHMMELSDMQGLDVHIVDNKRISEAVLGRQLYSMNDIGRYKSAVLVEKINRTYNTNFTCSTDRFTFVPKEVDFIISCVDNISTRHMISNSNFYKYWMDLGNDVTYGQVILGTKGDTKQPSVRGTKKRLPNFFEYFDGVDLSEEKDKPSCSAWESVHKQDLFINQTVATFAGHLLWILLKEFRIDHHGYIINLKQGKTMPIKIK